MLFIINNLKSIVAATPEYFQCPLFFHRIVNPLLTEISCCLPAIYEKNRFYFHVGCGIRAFRECCYCII